ncbi:uncharacterized protein LOC114239503 [Bombyx mandarina]|uniref:Uncharacterized protein n=2 Tax=Bombyx TaxID=7090 RepID=A0A8R2ARR6_BOMMO|nr:uncharacterized protein LOC101738368 [Bombyx mori]XP_028025526.1 uncharacterized protein LOC114239503 [Bombyx mandarina]
MVNYILFLDVLRQEEIEKFYKACQLHREFYKGYSKSPHPLDYFNESPYKWQCPPEISPIYLSFPPYHIKYKSPAALPTSTGRTIDIPALPHRSLAGRFNKSACKAFIR